MPGPAPRTAKRDRNPRGQGEQLRADLLDAAIDLLGDLADFESLSVRALTAQVGVTPTAFYLHFETKEQLADAVKDRCFKELRRYLLDAEKASGPAPGAQAEAMCLAYLRFADERPGHYRVMFHVDRSHPAPPPDIATEPSGWPSSAAAAFNDLLRAVTRCLNDDREPFEAAIMVWTGLHGYIGLRDIRHFPFPTPRPFVQLLLNEHLHRT
jgi:AcrR family transcriptional regulator